MLEEPWRRHLHAAARRRISLVEAGDELIGVVGFADLVGFTALSQQLNEAELAAVVDQFENLCFDVITEGGGRVVKMIGDEVMFTVDSPVAAAEMALALSEGTRDADELSDVRVGLAFGTLLERESDLFGPVVNLASRITKIAFPGSVVVSRELYEHLAGTPGYVLRSMRHRYLKNIGRVPLYVLRRARGSESRFADRRQALREPVRARVAPAEGAAAPRGRPRTATAPAPTWLTPHRLGHSARARVATSHGRSPTVPSNGRHGPPRQVDDPAAPALHDRHRGLGRRVEHAHPQRRPSRTTALTSAPVTVRGCPCARRSPGRPRWPSGVGSAALLVDQQRHQHVVGQGVGVDVADGHRVASGDHPLELRCLDGRQRAGGEGAGRHRTPATASPCCAAA